MTLTRIADWSECTYRQTEKDGTVYQVHNSADAFLAVAVDARGPVVLGTDAAELGAWSLCDAEAERRAAVIQAAVEACP